MFKKIILISSFFVLLGACAHKRYHHSAMTPEQHQAMAKAHQDTATCLADSTKNKEDCHKIMRDAMAQIKGKDGKCCPYTSKKSCKDKSSCKLDEKSGS